MTRQRRGIEWSPLARDDLDEIVSYAKRDSPAASQRIFSSLVRAARSLAGTPHRGRFVPELDDAGIRDWRELIVAPYRILYGVDEELVRIYAALDGRRDLNHLIVDRYLRVT